MNRKMAYTGKEIGLRAWKVMVERRERRKKRSSEKMSEERQGISVLLDL